MPGDKSVSHRSFLINALGTGVARVRGALNSEDVAASRRLVQGIGCGVEADGDDWIIRPGPLVEPADVIDCGNSGTTMRLGAGVLAHAPGLRILTGDASLRSRPMGRVLQPLSTFGVQVSGRGGGALAPLVLQGEPNLPGLFDLKIASAQVKSLCLLSGHSTGVRVREPRQSRDHTERMLRGMGADLVLQDGWLNLAPSTWTSVDVDVPGDLSSAAFWLCAAAISPGSEVVLPGVGINPTRDGVLRALRQMGANITLEDRTDGIEPTATLIVRGGGLSGTRIDGELALSCLDELPVLAVVAALAEGQTVIADASELRVKESDRIHRVVDGLKKMGVSVEERPDGMVIEGGHLSGPRATIDAAGDHRLAMAFAIAGLNHPNGVELAHADSVHTSYPEFFEHLARLSKEKA